MLSAYPAVIAYWNISIPTSGYGSFVSIFRYSPEDLIHQAGTVIYKIT